MTTSHSNVALRGYQVAASEAIQRGFTEYQRQLLVLPTGGGKTVVLAHLAAINQPRRTLVLAHREELITQAVDKIRAITGLNADIEMADNHASSDAPVVVASIQTLMRSRRRERWARDHFGLVVVDEAHHSLADSYLGTLRHFDDHAFVLGVTATPDRSDKRNLGRYYQNIAYEVTLLDLIKQNWLAPIRVKTVPLIALSKRFAALCCEWGLCTEPFSAVSRSICLRRNGWPQLVILHRCEIQPVP